MPLEHVLGERMLIHIQIYNLELFRRQENMRHGGNPTYHTCQSTGYHSYVSHNNYAFCRLCLSNFIAQRTLVIQSNTR